MTGRYPFHFGFYTNQDANEYGVATNFTMLPELLGKAGYATHMIGKWHLGYRSEELTPTRRGFESHLGYYWHGEDYFTHVRDLACGPPGVDFSNATADMPLASTWPARGFDGEYSAYIYAAEAGRVIRAHASKHTVGAGAAAVTRPLYLYLPFQNVHAPVEVPARFEALYDGVITDPTRKTFAGMVSALDEAVANITAALQETGLWADTFLLFSSDNGGPLGSANNYPLRGGKFTYWDGGVRVQSFLYSARRDLIPASMVGSTWAGMGHTVDIMPTFLAAAGVPFDPASTYSGDFDVPFDGLNLLPAIQANGTSPRSEVVHMIANEYNQAVCNQTTGVGGQGHCGAAITLGDFKLLVGYPGDDRWLEPPSAAPAAAGAMLGLSPPDTTCTPAGYLNGTCLHVFKGQISNFSATGPGWCCTECKTNPSCGHWSYKGKTCFLMTISTKPPAKSNQSECTSGILRSGGPPPPPPPPPGPPTPPCNMVTGYGCPCNPPSKGCLFNLANDPTEHVDLATDPGSQADFARLLARLEEVSKTGVVSTRAMLGKTQANADGVSACVVVNKTGFYEPFASHLPFTGYPAPP